MSEDDLKNAARLLVEQIAKLGDNHLQKNKFKDPSSEDEKRLEADMRELAAASRGLTKSFDALVKAMESPLQINVRYGVGQESAKYKFGFLFRFIEAMLTVVKIAGVDGLETARGAQRSRGGQTRGVQKQEEAQKWRPKALEIAKLNQELTRDEIAEKIRLDVPSAPGIDRIKSVIREWKRAGELPKLTERGVPL